MTERPAPLVPADVDLRGLPWMPIDTVRLLDSDLNAIATPEEFRAAVRLWCKSWHQVPAGSLPDDDRILAALSGTAGKWQKLREVALRGFVKCSDGRLYHPVIAEKAVEAMAFRAAQRDRAAKRWKKPGNAAASPGAHATASPAAMPETGQDRTGQEIQTPAASPLARDASRREPKAAASRIRFDPETGGFVGITEADELRWQEAYPAVPIPPAIAQAAAWLKANPANRKSNCERYLVNWFKRDQDKAARVQR